MTATNPVIKDSSRTASILFHLHKPVSAAPLIGFRIAFGLLMLANTVRFWSKGWIAALYVQPKFHFTYWGFDWVRPLGSNGMHVVFLVMAVTALLIAAGCFYRVSAIIFFLSFAYVELIDVTTYLNHYYFISLAAFLLIFLPANANYSVDAMVRPSVRSATVPAWTIGILRFQIAVVYVFAGLAKLDSDWLIQALPMKIWLPAKTDMPFVGHYLYQEWVAYFFSWFGAAYDLFIVFFLLNKKTRPVAYLIVVVFHLATVIFFPAIGMFPYIMMVSSLIFFSGSFHEQLLSILPDRLRAKPFVVKEFVRHRFLYAALILYTSFQLLFPIRFLLFPGRLFWNEEGFRFSWRVMLMEKSGIAFFRVQDKKKHQAIEVNNAEFLTPFQEKMMSTQPDLIVKYAHYLKKEYKKRGIANPELYAEVYVTLNGRRSTLFIDSTVNLAKISPGWQHYNWVLPFKN